jgi:MerR family transcriptional regulator, heat shock protein HspR
MSNRLDAGPEATGKTGSGAPGGGNGEASREAGYGIGRAARELGLHPRTLMAYERIGLIRPARRRTRRVYSDNDLRWIGCVQEFNRHAGVSLHGLTMLRRFLPCWAVREQVERDAGGGWEPPGAESLDRVHRAYSGQAPGECRSCGVYRAGREKARLALDSCGAHVARPW